MSQSLFEVLRTEKASEFESVIFPSAAVRGIAVSTNTTDASEQPTAQLASASNPRFMGHLHRDITVAGGPTVEDQVFNKGLEAPDKAGQETSVERVYMYAAESAAYIEQVTNPLVAATPLGTPVTFLNGKAKIAAVGDYAFYVLDAIIDPIDSASLPAKRFVFRKVPVFKVA